MLLEVLLLHHIYSTSVHCVIMNAFDWIKCKRLNLNFVKNLTNVKSLKYLKFVLLTFEDFIKDPQIIYNHIYFIGVYSTGSRISY